MTQRVLGTRLLQSMSLNEMLEMSACLAISFAPHTFPALPLLVEYSGIVSNPTYDTSRGQANGNGTATRSPFYKTGARALLILILDLYSV